MKTFKIFIILFISLNLTFFAQSKIPEKSPKTFIGKSLKEIDKATIKIGEVIKKFFGKRKILYKIKKGKHEIKIRKHKTPINYLQTKTITQTTQTDFKNFKKENNLEPKLEIKVMYPRIEPNKGYVSFQVGDFKYNRYLTGLTKDNIEYLKLKLPDSLKVECEVQKFRILPKRDVTRHYSFVLDHSGSMGDIRASKLQQGVYNAIKNSFKRNQNKKDLYSIHKFDGEGNIQHLVTSNRLKAIEQVLVPPRGLNGFGKSTAIKDALLQAVQNLSKDTVSESKIIFLFTDGVSNTDRSLLPFSEVIKMAIDNKINIAPIGFGNYVDIDLLNKISYFAGGNSYRVYNEDEFNQLFDNIVLDVEMNYEIEFSPCIFGDEIKIELKLKGLEKPLIGETFFSTPVKEGYSIDLNILFNKGSAQIDKKKYFNELTQILNLMKYKTNLNILIEGHTDKVGSEKSNIQLSNDRANNLKKYFIGQGINKNRITTKGFGWSNPAYPYQRGQIKNILNRRIEIKIIK